MILSFFLCSVLLFLKLYGFFKNYNKSETICGEIPCFALKISIARAWRFFDVYWLYLLPLTSNSLKGNFQESSHTTLKAVSWILLTLFSMSLLLKQNLHQNITRRRTSKRHVFYSVNITINYHQWCFALFNKSKTSSSTGKCYDWFLALGFWWKFWFFFS